MNLQGLRLPGVAGYSGREGRFFSFDFNKPDRPVALVGVNWDADMTKFMPHGLSVYEDAKTGTTLGNHY